MALQGFPQRNLHQFILWKVAPSRKLVLQDQERLQIWGKSALMRIARLKNSFAKGPINWWQRCNGYVEEEWASRWNGETRCIRLIEYTTIGLRMPGYGAAEVFIDFTEELRHTETNPMCKIHKSRRTSCWHSETKIHRLDWFVQVNLMSVTPMLQNLRIALRKRRNGKKRCAREAAWRQAKSVLKFKEKNKATFFSPSENRCLPASTLKPEEREFVVDSGASMHMISKKDLNSAEMDTLTKSCSPTIVITANGEVQTHEGTTVNVKELENSWLWKSANDTPAVLSLGKLCDENGYSYEWINGQKPHLIKNRIRIPCNSQNFVPIVVPGLSSSSSGSDSSTSRTLSRQGSHCSTSSSSSSSHHLL